MVGPLQGLLVADLSRVLAGPYCTMLLADLGATVIKVERPESGDDTRAWGPPFASDGLSTYFHSVNRNKESLVADLHDQADLARLHRLVDQADVIVENFKVGSLTTFGLDYTAVATRNPRAIYCSISGFGSGCGAGFPGYDLLVQAASGLMSITGDQEPMKVGVAVVDVLTGLHACVAILAALHERDLSGVGQHVQVNLLSSALSALVNQASSVLGAGIVPGLLGNAHPSIAPYEVYTTADRPLVIAVGNNQQFRSLCTVLGHPEWAADPRFDSNPVRVAHRDALRELLTSVLRQGSAEQWHESLTRAGVPCGPINTVAQGLDLARTLDLAPQSPPADPTDPVAHVAPPFRLSRTPATYRTRPPQLGEDTARIVDRLGLDG
jgi:crotonobetainyl-CoA:carnitine CoA-transferase CaiB-like acyl-CoA transferase